VLQYGPFIYLLDARDWHAHHAGGPDATLILEFAAASRRHGGRPSRATRGRLPRSGGDGARDGSCTRIPGWVATQRVFVGRDLPLLRRDAGNLGDISSPRAPSGGILVTARHTETVSAVVRRPAAHGRRSWWSGAPGPCMSPTSTYRERTAKLLNVDPRFPCATPSRPPPRAGRSCITPSADSAAVPVMTCARQSPRAPEPRRRRPREAALSFSAFLEESQAARPSGRRHPRGVRSRGALQPAALARPSRPCSQAAPPVAAAPDHAAVRRAPSPATPRMKSPHRQSREIGAAGDPRVLE